jgi:hypothetical protein|nr:MAG TPA: Protein of unknown function (DUF1351) [Caudoviricetes sp.]
MELKIYNPSEENGFLKAIEWNYDELKAELSQKLEDYKGLVYTEEQIKEAKADRAKLNALATAIDSKRKEIKKQCLQPYEAFEAQIKDLLALIKEPVTLIDTQIKDFEEEKKKKKLEEVKELFEKLKTEAGEELEFISFEQVFEDKFLNASTSLKQVETVINNIFNSVKCNLKTIAELKDYTFEATEVYKETLNLNTALEKAKYMVDMAERKKVEEEKREQEKSEEIKEVAPDPQQEAEEPAADVKREWTAFEAYLSAKEAKMLAAWLKLNNIKIRRI